MSMSEGSSKINSQQSVNMCEMKPLWDLPDGKPVTKCMTVVICLHVTAVYTFLCSCGY